MQARINSLWQLNGRCKLRRDIWKNKHLFAFLKINAVRNKPITKKVYFFIWKRSLKKAITGQNVKQMAKFLSTTVENNLEN
ncbi:hypothetical protein ACX8XN_10040 [Calditrichota bacterium GD2]